MEIRGSGDYRVRLLRGSKETIEYWFPTRQEATNHAFDMWEMHGGYAGGATKERYMDGYCIDASSFYG